LKDKFSITRENKKLAVWLSEDKTDNLKDIEKYDSEVEILIFKQAIATGWDCPRAQILVMFREIKSITFEIQTVGRIMRMPELFHYENDELNNAYVYTNFSKINIED
jgi:type III restriction enzyme